MTMPLASVAFTYDASIAPPDFILGGLLYPSLVCCLGVVGSIPGFCCGGCRSACDISECHGSGARVQRGPCDPDQTIPGLLLEIS